MLYGAKEHVRKNQKPMPRPRPDIIKIIVTREFAVMPCPRSLFRLHAEREREKGERKREKEDAILAPEDLYLPISIFIRTQSNNCCNGNIILTNH